MMGIIKGVVMIVLLILSKVFEANAANEKKKGEIIDALVEGVKNRDPSAITLALSGLR